MVLFLRAILLACFAVASGAAYGAAAGAVFVGEPGIGVTLGIIVGVTSIGIVVPLLLKTRLHLSMPFAFFATLTACIATGVLGPYSVLTGLFTLTGVCGWSRIHLKDPRFYPTPGHCPICNYPLANLPTPICPECGTDSSLARPG